MTASLSPGMAAWHGKGIFPVRAPAKTDDPLRPQISCAMAEFML